jgi:hypothetical protein
MITERPVAVSARERRPKPRPIGWAGISLWALVTAVGAALVSASRLADYLFPGVQAITTVSLALLQWLILRWWIPKVGWWAPVTIVAWTVGPAVGLTVATLILELAGMGLRVVTGIEMPRLLEAFVGYIFVGVVIGACQWLVLRRSLSRARWWIAALALTWGVSEFAAAGGAEFVDGLKETTGPELWYAGYWGTNALLHALLTGAALAWITRGSLPEGTATQAAVTSSSL